MECKWHDLLLMISWLHPPTCLPRAVSARLALLQYFLTTQSRVVTMEGVKPCVGGREMRNEQE